MKGETHQAPAFAASKRLRRRKAERDIDLDAFSGQTLRCLKPSAIKGTFTTMFLWILASSLPFLHHGISFETDDFCADRPIDDVTNFDEHFPKDPSFFRHERGIRRHAVKQVRGSPPPEFPSHWLYQDRISWHCPFMSVIVEGLMYCYRLLYEELSEDANGSLLGPV